VRVVERFDVRLTVFAVLAIAFGVWALVMLSPLDDGTLQRIGPALVPRLFAIALVIAGLLILARAVTGIATAPPRLLPGPLRFALAALLIVIVLLPNIAVLLGDVPPVAALGRGLQEFMLAAGPAEFLALFWLRWTLAIAIGVVIAGEGIVTGLAALLIGGLLGLAGDDVASGATRLPQVAALLDHYPYAIALGTLLVLILCRVNPLPAAFAYIGAAVAAEMFQRVMLLAKGNPLPVLGRPLTLTLVVAIVLITLALVWYRWPWRGGTGRPPT